MSEPSNSMPTVAEEHTPQPGRCHLGYRYRKPSGGEGVTPPAAPPTGLWASPRGWGTVARTSGGSGSPAAAPPRGRAPDSHAERPPRSSPRCPCRTRATAGGWARPRGRTPPRASPAGSRVVAPPLLHGRGPRAAAIGRPGSSSTATSTIASCNDGETSAPRPPPPGGGATWSTTEVLRPEKEKSSRGSLARQRKGKGDAARVTGAPGSGDHGAHPGSPGPR